MFSYSSSTPWAACTIFVWTSIIMHEFGTHNPAKMTTCSDNTYLLAAFNDPLFKMTAQCGHFLEIPPKTITIPPWKLSLCNIAHWANLPPDRLITPEYWTPFICCIVYMSSRKLQTRSSVAWEKSKTCSWLICSKIGFLYLFLIVGLDTFPLRILQNALRTSTTTAW